MRITAVVVVPGAQHPPVIRTRGRGRFGDDATVGIRKSAPVKVVIRLHPAHQRDACAGDVHIVVDGDVIARLIEIGRRIARARDGSRNAQRGRADIRGVVIAHFVGRGGSGRFAQAPVRDRTQRGDFCCVQRSIVVCNGRSVDVEGHGGLGRGPECESVVHLISERVGTGESSDGLVGKGAVGVEGEHLGVGRS